MHCCEIRINIMSHCINKVKLRVPTNYSFIMYRANLDTLKMQLLYRIT